MSSKRTFRKRLKGRRTRRKKRVKRRSTRKKRLRKARRPRRRSRGLKRQRGAQGFGRDPRPCPDPGAYTIPDRAAAEVVAKEFLSRSAAAGLATQSQVRAVAERFLWWQWCDDGLIKWSSANEAEQIRLFTEHIIKNQHVRDPDPKKKPKSAMKKT